MGEFEGNHGASFLIGTSENFAELGKTLNILHLEASTGWGGQEMRILREAEGMRRRGHNVILAVMKKGLLIEKARRAGFIVYELNFQKKAWLFTLFSLLKIIRRHQISLVNTHSSLDSWIGGIAARLSRIKVLRTRHLSGAIRAGWNSRLLYGFLADFVVTTCAEIVPMVCKQANKASHLCRSIATGVDPEAIVYEKDQSVRFRESLGVQPDQLLIGTACFMRSWKGILDFLEAANRLREETSIRWVIIGGGHFDTYKKKADELNLEGIVHFTGHLENPFPAMASLDVFALLSTANEGVSQAILQAAFLEKPLIATATGGLSEVCLPGETGIRVNRFASDEVAAAALTMQKNPEKRALFGKQAKELVLNRFIFEKTLDQMEEVYQLINSHS